MNNLRRVAPSCLLGAVLLLAAPASADTPFDQGKIRINLALGMASGFEHQYFVVGAGVGYFVFDGLEASVAGDFWLGGSPSVTRVSPGIRYVFHFVPVLQPYAGVFYRHWFVGGNYADIDTMGARGGVVWGSDRAFSLGIGVVYEQYVSECNANSCSFVYPELVVTVTF
ncbi:MAG: hypothetical protein A2289_10625 [Deltaproteobacteria bacterium RIFOXYA12_FULL_58_15]|nr:MAG: hypothetical protein A2289_10625 [Deltaproteobacteria bacterium RIFOXYA12_FULL_58_15]OGR12425.1 MAG: hypothetical protein A2341_19885 [Deltaproteobacteria bacterium RIFOXYB12_FULL_58_9]